MSESLDRFAVEYQTVNGMTEDRRRLQIKELEAFAALAGKDAPEECDGNDLRRYMAKRLDDGLHVNTVRLRANMIRAFFTWAFSAGLVTGDTLMAIRFAKNPKGSTGRSLPKPYSAKELKQFWRELDERWPHVEKKWWSYWRMGRSRYKRIASSVVRLQIEAIVALALDCGLRRIEILSVGLDDIHPDNAFVVVPMRGERTNGKNRYREVPLTDDARLALHRWLEMRTELKPKHDRPWIMAYPTMAEGRWLDPMNMPSLKKLFHQNVGHQPWRLHRFRHTCGTNWLRAGMELSAVSELLGHSSLQQTLAYAEVARADVERQVRASEARFAQMTGRAAA